MPVNIRRRDKWLKISEKILKSKFQSNNKYSEKDNDSVIKGLADQDQYKNSRRY